MRTTLKRVDIGSAFRVGVVVYALLFAVFGLLFVGLQGMFISAIARFADNADAFAGIVGGSILSLLCFYAVGVVAAAIFGGIQFAIGALCYNLAANWVGGIRIELEREEDSE